MTFDTRLIARRPPTPVPAMKGSGGRLPEDLVSEQVQRLAIFSAVGAGLWTFGLLQDRLLLRFASTSFVPSTLVTAIEIAGIVAAVAMFAFVRYSRTAADVKVSFGFGFMLMNALGVAVMNTTTGVPMQVPPMYVSWIAVVILVFSMILWTKPRTMLVVSLAAASMDPLVVWIASLRGVAVPGAFDVFVLFVPNYVCAIVATVPATILQGLGRRLHEARQLGSYRLVELLGHGGMGEVWRAEHRLLARNAAVKLVRPEVLGAGSEEEARVVLRRFEREALATSALSSPHTIQVFDFGVTEEGAFYYVMELLAGRDLESLVREFGPVSSDRAIFLLRQVCHSLADAHARGLVHRDIKPANIYVCRMGLEYDFVKVLDFGLVKMRNRGAQEVTLTNVEHATTGTPAYMAPEVILGEADVDRRADVYSLGCVAYYLLTGQLVFEADTPMKMMLQHVQSIPTRPSARTELPIPRELEDFVMACLEKDPDKRPQDAEALLRWARGCPMCSEWNHESARSWWELHMPDLTGPLTVGAVDADSRSRAGVSA